MHINSKWVYVLPRSNMGVGTVPVPKRKLKYYFEEHQSTKTIRCVHVWYTCTTCTVPYNISFFCPGLRGIWGLFSSTWRCPTSQWLSSPFHLHTPCKCFTTAVQYIYFSTLLPTLCHSKNFHSLYFRNVTILLRL